MENNYFPEDIIGKILVKLPVKDVIRCSAVCKSWNSLVKTPTFIQTHLNNQTTAGDVSRLLLLISLQSNDLHWDNPASSFGQYSKLLNPIRSNKNSSWTKGMDYEVIGTCNGLVGLAVSSSYIDPCPPVILWNPSIRKFGFLPSPSRAVECYRYESYSLCYDSRIGDYKVVRIVMEPDREVEVEVWSLARGTWKSLSNVPADFPPYTDRTAFVNGAFHWVQRHHTREGEMDEDCTVSVVALDMVDESFRNVEIRQGFCRDYPPMISKYHGDGDHLWLALFEIQGNSSFDLWVMKEYGVVESWTKLFNVRLLGSPEEEPCVEPLGLTKSGHAVVRWGRDFEFTSFKTYDPKDKQFRDFGNEAYHYYFMDSFVESLVLLGQTNVFFLLRRDSEESTTAASINAACSAFYLDKNIYQPFGITKSHQCVGLIGDRMLILVHPTLKFRDIPILPWPLDSLFDLDPYSLPSGNQNQQQQFWVFCTERNKSVFKSCKERFQFLSSLCESTSVEFKSCTLSSTVHN